MKTRKFWLVWCERGAAPTYRHISLADAKVEAKRLAIAHSDQKFVVMESVCSVRAMAVEWSQATEDRDVPF